MAALRFLSNRNIDVDSLFFNSEPTTAQVNFNGAMTALGNALEKQVKTWWDICTLEH